MAVQTVPFGLFEVIFKFNKNYKKCSYTYRNDYDDKNNEKVTKVQLVKDWHKMGNNKTNKLWHFKDSQLNK